MQGIVCMYIVLLEMESSFNWCIRALKIILHELKTKERIPWWHYIILHEVVYFQTCSGYKKRIEEGVEIELASSGNK